MRKIGDASNAEAPAAAEAGRALRVGAGTGALHDLLAEHRGQLAQLLDKHAELGGG